MNATVERIVELLFENLEMTEEVSAIKDEVMNNCQERFDDMISEGKDEDAAIGMVVESLKGMDEMLAKYPRKEAAQADGEDGERELTFTTEGLRAINVSIPNRDVTVEPSEDEQVHVICDDVQELKIARQGDNLCMEENDCDNDENPQSPKKPPYFHMSIRGRSINWNVTDLNSLKDMLHELRNGIANGIFSEPAAVTLQLPEHFSPEVRVEVACGDVKVQNVRLSRLNASSASGDIEVELPDDIMLEKVRLESASGDVEAAVYAREVSVQSTSGDVRLEGRMENAKINSTSGDTHVQADVAQLRISTVSGDANLVCESDELTSVVGSSVSGDINLTLPDDVQAQVTTSTISGDVNNRHHGNGPAVVAVKLNTVSGDINIH